MVRLIIAGSRTITNASYVLKYLDYICKGVHIECIISGMCHGPDMFGVEWATKNGIKIIECPADWETHKKKAGYIRNSEMANNYGATHLIVFWDGKSKGTKHMIDVAKKANLKVHVVEYNPKRKQK